MVSLAGIPSIWVSVAFPSTDILAFPNTIRPPHNPRSFSVKFPPNDWPNCILSAVEVKIIEKNDR